ncbi:DNA-directed RNA polymerase specialized sigma subunit, sigma24 family [Mucilaginibacter sp. OK268]|jgi:DNA-directed RNA polymerase specialized sigma24 family protein|uniref:RNA polymerase sigma factor n=1 Tax=Mucilaginibacter sp. OK268 TaxID=1881048 RepID=UPI00088C0E04|nr:sigma-70 family RNA polymerase sigma factor [Mucilaginibacter sp. OK268]SDP99719.1 DNA-directed RNA polymerase specialized sigma subunit, sigma24 family [Mucilaginibacter sp. OK268]
MNNAAKVSPAEDEPDDDLIALMGMKEDFPDEALAAYGKIYQHYWEIMLTIAKGVTRDEKMAEDLIADTFNVIYNRASTFKRGKLRNPDNIRLSITKWMTTIMEHVFYDNFLDDAYKKHSDSETFEESCIIEKQYIVKRLNTDFDEFIGDLENEEETEIQQAIADSSGDSENIKHVQAYINKQSDRDRDIILTTYNYYETNKYTPTEVLDELEDKWVTTRENIRKILQKFRKAIKEELQSKMIIRK